MPTVDVLDSTMYYEETGSGTPLVFLHGNPTSSHLWRHVLPRIGAGRRLAPDLIGMGRSGKPAIPYRFADHARYLDAWFGRLGLDDVVLVGQDWGGALAFDWATRHPDRIRGLAFMETIVRPMSWEEFPAAARGRFEALRTPGVGERLVLEENVFAEAFRRTVLSPLSDEDLRVYQEPYPTYDSRRPMLQWARSMPLDGEPADVVSRIAEYDRWLAASTDVPKLLLTFDSSPTLMIGAELAAWCAANIAALEVRDCGPAAHLAPEDQPEAIATAIVEWAERHQLWSAASTVRGEVKTAGARTRSGRSTRA
jgi:haloalkane dehalogenase